MIYRYAFFVLVAFLFVALSIQGQTLAAELVAKNSGPSTWRIELTEFFGALSTEIPTEEVCSLFETEYGFPKTDIKLSIVSDTSFAISSPLPCVGQAPMLRKVVYAGVATTGDVSGGYDVVWQSNGFHNSAYKNIDVSSSDGVSLLFHIDSEIKTVDTVDFAPFEPLLYACSGAEINAPLLVSGNGEKKVVIETPESAKPRAANPNAAYDDYQLSASMGEISLTRVPITDPPYETYNWTSKEMKDSPMFPNKLSVEAGPSGFHLDARESGAYLLKLRFTIISPESRAFEYSRLQTVTIL